MESITRFKKYTDKLKKKRFTLLTLTSIVSFSIIGYILYYLFIDTSNPKTEDVTLLFIITVISTWTLTKRVDRAIKRSQRGSFTAWTLENYQSIVNKDKVLRKLIYDNLLEEKELENLIKKKGDKFYVAKDLKQKYQQFLTPGSEVVVKTKGEIKPKSFLHFQFLNYIDEIKSHPVLKGLLVAGGILFVLMLILALLDLLSLMSEVVGMLFFFVTIMAIRLSGARDNHKKAKKIRNWFLENYYIEDDPNHELMNYLLRREFITKDDIEVKGFSFLKEDEKLKKKESFIEEPSLEENKQRMIQEALGYPDEVVALEYKKASKGCGWMVLILVVSIVAALVGTYHFSKFFSITIVWLNLILYLTAIIGTYKIVSNYFYSKLRKKMKENKETATMVFEKNRFRYKGEYFSWSDINFKQDLPKLYTVRTYRNGFEEKPKRIHVRKENGDFTTLNLAELSLPAFDVIAILWYRTNKAKGTLPEFSEETRELMEELEEE